MKLNYKLLILTASLVILTLIIGSLFTSSTAQSDWYNSIKPGITPPNIVFPIVWTTLFILIWLSFYLAISKNKKFNSKIFSLFLINLVLNIFWSFLFFYLKNPKAAFIEIIFLWASIILLIPNTYKIRKISAYFLVPYLLWVSFAVILNYFIVF